MAETIKTTTTKDTSTDSTPTTEPKIVTVAQNNADGLFYYGRPPKDVTASYANPVGRVPGEVGGTANINEARGTRTRRIDGYGRSGAGWYQDVGSAVSPIVKFAAIGLAAYLIFK